MATFLIVIHGLQRRVTRNLFKDDSTLFNNVFLKALIKEMSFRHIYGWVSRS